jgi:hypothetical protein
VNPFFTVVQSSSIMLNHAVSRLLPFMIQCFLNRQIQRQS